MRKILVTLTLAGAALALGAAPAVAGGGNVKQFCKAWLAVKAADEPSPRQIDRLTNSAPPEIADTVNTVLSRFEELGDDAFFDTEFTTAYADVNAFVVDSCGYEQIDVSMQDYAFSGVPEEVDKGKVGFAVTNEGEELHELSVFRLKDDATLDDILDLPEDASDADFRELVTPVRGGAFAFPGGADVGFFNLKKTGDYVALCFIPVGSTPEAGDEGGSGPPHFMEGMAAEFEVVK